MTPEDVLRFPFKLKRDPDEPDYVVLQFFYMEVRFYILIKFYTT